MQARENALPVPWAGNTREPAWSSWPPAAARLAWLAQRAATQVATVAATGASATPTRRLWQLYEDWVAVSFHDRLVELYGAPSQVARGLLGRWRLPDKTVELWNQPQFVYAPARRIGGMTWRGYGHGTLTPDLVLDVTRPTGNRTTILDAKAYGQIETPGVIDDLIAKYLWGLRRDVDPGAATSLLSRHPDLALVVSPQAALGGQAPQDLSRTAMLQAVPPPGGPGVIAVRVRELL